MDFFLLIHPVGTILSYVFYWIAVIGTLVYLKFSEVSFLFSQAKRDHLPKCSFFPSSKKRVAPP